MMAFTAAAAAAAAAGCWTDHPRHHPMHYCNTRGYLSILASTIPPVQPLTFTSKTRDNTDTTHGAEQQRRKSIQPCGERARRIREVTCARLQTTSTGIAHRPGLLVCHKFPHDKRRGRPTHNNGTGYDQRGEALHTHKTPNLLLCPINNGKIDRFATMAYLPLAGAAEAPPTGAAWRPP